MIDILKFKLSNLQHNKTLILEDYMAKAKATKKASKKTAGKKCKK